jgi:hypothetical protein
MEIINYIFIKDTITKIINFMDMINFMMLFIS